MSDNKNGNNQKPSLSLAASKAYMGIVNVRESIAGIEKLERTAEESYRPMGGPLQGGVEF